MAADAVPGGAPTATAVSRVVIAVTVGNVLEWFDVLVHG
jgi:hypothetical protein